MSVWIKSKGYTWVGSIVAIILIASFYIQQTELQTVGVNITKWGTIIFSWMLLIGVGTLSMFHLRKVSARTPGQWQYSVLLLFLIYFTALLGYLGEYVNPIFKGYYDTMYVNVYAVLNSATYAICAFYLISMCFRSFRVRTIESIVFVFTSIIIIIYNMPAGVAIWSGITSLGDWIFNYPSTAGSRAWIMVIAMGAVVAGFRRIIHMTE